MKKAIITALIGAVVLSGCQPSDGGGMLNTDIPAADTRVSEPVAADTSAFATAPETASETSPETTAAPEAVPELRDDDAITLSEEQINSSPVYYSMEGYINRDCTVNGSEVSVSWQGEAGHTYSLRLRGGDTDTAYTTDKTSYTFADIPKNTLCSVYVYDMTEDTEYGSYVCSFDIMLTDIADCVGVSAAYNDDDKYVFTWDKSAGAELYAVFLNKDFYKAVATPQVTVTDLCPGADMSLTVVPAAFDGEGGVVCGQSCCVSFVPEGTGNIAAVEYRENRHETEYGDRVIYTYDCVYPAVSYADSSVSDSINKAIEERLIKCGSDDELISEYASMAEDMGTAYINGSSEDNQKISVIRNTENILSLRDHGDVYMIGAAHGMYGETYMHFDPKTGRQMRFEDIFDREAFYEGLKDKMAERLFADYDYGAPSDYYSYLDEAFSGEYGADAYANGIGWLDTHWYYEKGVLTVSFDVYQIGSFAEGIKQAEFSYDEIKDYLINGSYLE